MMHVPCYEVVKQDVLGLTLYVNEQKRLVAL